MNDVIDRLVRAGLLQPAPADRQSARRWLGDAERHLRAATEIAAMDRAGSYTLLYDASRKALAAILLTHGFRMLATPGSHAALAEAGASLASTEEELSRLKEFDRMRRQRNRSEYGLQSFGADELKRATELASWIVLFARAQLA